MSALRERLKKPATYLVVVLALLGLAAADSLRPPDRQITGRLFVGAVHGYQYFGRPLSKKFVACRYSPTCSEYSVEAVRKYGIRRGVVMSVKRLSSCTRAVPFGTVDPVP